MKKNNKLEHPCFPQPIDLDIKVWRYIDLSKLIDILSRKSLFLSRLDLLRDVHEGSITKVNFDARQTQFEKKGISNLIPKIEKINKKISKSMYINCWYFDNYESEAMWKLYCPDNKGIAIQTTYRKLVESVNYDDNLFIGYVNYIDYENEWFPAENLFYPVMHKRKAFQYEKEIRLVKTDSKFLEEDTEIPPLGISCPWDIDKYAENIYVNPYSQNWYYEVIKDILEKYNCKINVNWSTMKVEPYY
jgi:hypothetical protein